MTLKVRFSFVFAGYTILVLALFAAAYFILERRAARSEQRAEQLRTVDKIVSVCQAMHLGSSAIVALNYINVLKQDPAIVAAGCLDPSHRVQAFSDPRMLGTVMADVPGRIDGKMRLARAGDGKPLWAWFAPVVIRDQQAGAAYVSYDQAVLDRQIRAKLIDTLRQLALVGASAFGAAVFIGLAFAWSLSRPMMKLAEAARQLGDGKWDLKTPIAGRQDEVGFLAGELQTMAQKLKQLDDLKSDFIHNVSHDLRSPMAAIRMYVECMLTNDPEKDKIIPRHREWLTIIMDNAMRLNVFVTNILDAAKMKAGQLELHPQPVSVDKAARSIQKLFQMVAANQDIGLEVDVPAGLPPIAADPIRFDQVLTNLVSNALKFTPPGGKVRIEARAQGKGVAVTVADTGRGISREDLGRLFERFRQIDANAQARSGIRGTGLGLYITKATVEAMGGKVSVESEPGKGSRFTVLMPAGG